MRTEKQAKTFVARRKTYQNVVEMPPLVMVNPLSLSLPIQNRIDRVRFQHTSFRLLVNTTVSFASNGQMSAESNISAPAPIQTNAKEILPTEYERPNRQITLRHIDLFMFFTFFDFVCFSVVGENVMSSCVRHYFICQLSPA